MKIKLSFLLLLSLLFDSCGEKTKMVENGTGQKRTEQEMDRFFMHLKDTLEMPGLSITIINKSQVSYQKSFGLIEKGLPDAVQPNTVFEAASLSKPVFASFAMKQAEKGLLDLDRPLFDYLPYKDLENDERSRQITARMVLSHSSGLPNWRKDSLTIAFRPGTDYMYSGEGYKYLAQVLAKINRIQPASLDSLFQEDIAIPAEARQFHFGLSKPMEPLKATGHIDSNPSSRSPDYKDLEFSAAGGLQTDARSYAQFLIALWNNKLISKNLQTEMLNRQIDLPSNDLNKLLIGASSWSLGFGMIPVQDQTYYFHGGNNEDFQSWVHFNPDIGYGIIVFSNSNKIQNPLFFELFFEFMNDGIRFDLEKLNVN